MRSIIFATVAALGFATPALAGTVSVITNPVALESNFQTPTNLARVGYDLTLSDNGTSVNGTIVQTGGVAAGAFANLYFDLNPSVADGSDLGFELGTSGARAFIAGGDGTYANLAPSSFSFGSTTDANGLYTLNFSLANALFTSQIAGLNYSDTAPGVPQTFEPNVTLRLSQSLGYSVAGGATYGPDRLGTVNVSSVAAVPEPAMWAMMLMGVGTVGFSVRRRRSLSSTQTV